jgi:pyruvate kinase
MSGQHPRAGPRWQSGAAHRATRRTLLICTIGPASIDRLDDLARAGSDVARINFSHSDPQAHARAVEAVRRAAESTGRSIEVLADLRGPKVRLGALEDGAAELSTGATFTLRSDDGPGDGASAGTNHPGLGGDLQVGDRILLADGAAELKVIAVGSDVVTRVLVGGRIRSRVGVNVPGERLSLPALSERDRADAARALELGASIIAQSFVRRAEDVAELREAIGSASVQVMAKIETRPAIDDIDRILEVADSIMVARGDLGVEIPFEEVPIVQKELIRAARTRGRPVVVATQMLESMTAAPRPTRAEASDVANAVFDGATGVMLSAETAIGAFPIEAARAAVRICAAAEAAMARWAVDAPVRGS